MINGFKSDYLDRVIMEYINANKKITKNLIRMIQEDVYYANQVSEEKIKIPSFHFIENRVRYLKNEGNTKEEDSSSINSVIELVVYKYEKARLEHKKEP